MRRAEAGGSWVAPAAGGGRGFRGRAASAAIAFGVVAQCVGLAAADNPPATPYPGVPSPDECTVPALTLDDLNAAIGGGVGAPIAVGAPAATGDREVVPVGRPAPQAVERAVHGVVREYVACQNAGEPLRAYALSTDAHLARLFRRQGPWDRTFYEGMATPMPGSVARRSTIVGMEAARILPDGRAGATVTISYPAIPTPKTFFFTFARDGDHWAIDDILGEVSFSVP